MRPGTPAMVGLAVLLAMCLQEGPGEPALFRSLHAGEDPGAEEEAAGHRWFDDATAWEGHWADVRGSDRDRPEVDWETERVLGVWGAVEGTTSHRLRVLEVEPTDASWRVLYGIQEPGQDCVVGMALMRPYEYVAVPRDWPVAEDADLVEASREAYACRSGET